MGECGGESDGELVILTNLLIREDFGAGIDVALDEVTGKAVADAEGAFEIDGIAGGEIAEVGETKGLVEEIKTHRVVFDFGHGETGPVVRDAFAEGDLGGEAGFYPELRARFDWLQRDNFAAFFDDPGKHGRL